MKTNLRHVPRLTSPYWCFNGHIHTIGRSLFGDTNPPSSIERIEIPTPDNDFLELDCAINPDSDAIIVLLHGMEGSAKRYYMVEAMKKLISNNYSVVGVNFRSCGSKMNNRPRFYHAGDTEDIKTVVRWIRENYPDKTMGVTGFSLGANMLAKYLAEQQDTPVKIAVAVSVPYDLRLSSILLTKGFGRVYNYYLLRSLRKKLKVKREKFPDLPSFSGSTIYEFDDQVTAKIHGFENAEDYYQQCSARNFAGDIRTPTLFVHSKDDPLCPTEAMPIAKINENKFTDYIVTGKGGHVGFWSRSMEWLNFIIENYFSSNI